MITVTCTYGNGDTVTTGFNGTFAEAESYFVGQTFNVGLGPDDNVQTCIAVVLVGLEWESGGTDEPGDQNASSSRHPHSYWSLGPNNASEWGVELIVRDEQLEEILAAGVHLGHFATEADAKAAAERYEARQATGAFEIVEMSGP